LHFLSGERGKGRQGALISKRILFLIILGTTLAADLVTKWAAFRYLSFEKRLHVIPGCFALRNVWNPGILFGVKAPPWFTFIVSAVATVIIIWYLVTRRGRPAVIQVYLALLLSGVLGNLYDRLTFCKVRDFIELHIRDAASWPNFNLADAYLVIGVALALIQVILTGDQAKKNSAEGEKPNSKGIGEGDKPKADVPAK